MNGLSLRPLAEQDRDFLLRLRNSPSVRNGFFSSAPVSSGDHQIWFQQYLEDKRSHCFIAQVKNTFGGSEPIGYCRFDHIGASNFAVSIAVEPGFQSSGWGRKILTASLVRLRALIDGQVTVCAEVLQDNDASASLFHNAGFFRIADSTSGRIVMKMEL